MKQTIIGQTFLSAIGFRNGDILCDPSIDSHEDIINLHCLNDSGLKLRNWIRIEFRPDKYKEDIADLSKYKLHYNEDDSEFPWIKEAREIWINKLRIRLSRTIIKKDISVLGSGTYILKEGIIGKILYCRIIGVEDSVIIKDAGFARMDNLGRSKIEKLRFAIIGNAEYATIENADYAIINDAGHCKIKNAGFALIENINHATIENKEHVIITNNVFPPGSRVQYINPDSNLNGIDCITIMSFNEEMLIAMTNKGEVKLEKSKCIKL